jgi:large subunit ribosomal protein L15
VTLNLSDLHPDPGSRPSRRRVGRGHGSGRGKTSGKGEKGQKARAGGHVPAWFEGGQNPLVHRMPMKRGFRFSGIQHRVKAETVNLRQLNVFAEGLAIDRNVLIAAGLVDSRARKVKVLGDGDLTHAIWVSVEEYSASARAKIEAAGGKAIVVGAPVVEAAAGEQETPVASEE